MSMPSVRAASSTLVPLGTVTVLPSIVSVTVSDGAAERLRGVAGHAHLSHSPPIMLIMPKIGTMSAIRWPWISWPARRQVHERRRPAVRLVRAAGAVGDDVEAELAVAALDERVGLAGRHADAVDDVLEVADHRLDRVVRVALRRQRDARIVDHDRAVGDLLQALAQDPDRLLDLLDAHQVAVVAVAGRADAGRRTRARDRPSTGSPCGRRSRRRTRARSDRRSRSRSRPRSSSRRCRPCGRGRSCCC